MPTPTLDTARSIAIVGAGIAGLTAAIRLQEAGHQVVVFEKSRGPGGRLASRRMTGGGTSVDIGAQYFTMRTPAFREFLDEYAGAKTYGQWPATLQHQRDDLSWEPFKRGERFVGVPRMTAISRALSAHVEAWYETRIEYIAHKTREKLVLTDTNGHAHGPFDAVIITTPPLQAQALLATLGDGELAQDAVFSERALAACWTLALRFNNSLNLGSDGFAAKHPVLQWLANNSSKPGRGDNGNGTDEWWVLHARADWSDIYQNTDKTWIAEQMLAAFQDVTGVSSIPAEQFAHRWLYAKTTTAEPGPGHRWNAEHSIGLCGDWLVGGRVEGAFESASTLVRDMGGFDIGESR